MNSDKIVEVLKAVHNIFPVPTEFDFKGTHGFTLTKEGKLELGIWRLAPDTVKCWSFVFDNEEITEDLVKNELLPAIIEAEKNV